MPLLWKDDWPRQKKGTNVLDSKSRDSKVKVLSTTPEVCNHGQRDWSSAHFGEFLEMRRIFTF